MSKCKDLNSGSRLGTPCLADSFHISSDSDENDIFTRDSPTPAKSKKPAEKVKKWQPLLWRRIDSKTGSGDAGHVQPTVRCPFPDCNVSQEMTREKPLVSESEVSENRRVNSTRPWTAPGRQVTITPRRCLLDRVQHVQRLTFL